MTYELLENGAAIRHVECGRVSHHPEDVRQRYCGACREFLMKELQFGPSSLEQIPLEVLEQIRRDCECRRPRPCALEPGHHRLVGPLEEAAADSPILYAALFGWRSGRYSQQEALESACIELVRENAELKRQLTKAISEAPPPIILREPR